MILRHPPYAMTTFLLVVFLYVCVSVCLCVHVSVCVGYDV